ncbi:MAG: DUF2254 domain-containing protein [Reyranella sp.]
MGWNRWYSARSYLRSSLWIVPFVTFLAYLVMVRVIDALDSRFGSLDYFSSFGVSGLTAALQTIITLTSSFLVFTFGSLLVAIQIAGGQLTPRIIATTLLRDNAIRFSVGLFIFSLLFAVGALVRLETSESHLILLVANVLGLVSVATFLFLIDYAARLLRPVSIVWRVGEEGIAVIRRVYPDVVEQSSNLSPQPGRPAGPSRAVLHQARSGIVLAVNIEALTGLARRADGVIEVIPLVGDFLATGTLLFRLHGGARNIEDGKLAAQVALGAERTIEQDATFAFRVIVDVAIKALSKAINDPTTAVLALDQLHRLLHTAGARHLRGEEIRDQAGQLRVLFRTPDWEDFVHLTCREIRLYGAENFQVARRLRAMIGNLIQTLPARRHPALREELALLDATLEKLYLLPQDLALAHVPDTQGLGGAAIHASNATS